MEIGDDDIRTTVLLDEGDELEELDARHHTLHGKALVSVQLGDCWLSHGRDVLFQSKQSLLKEEKRKKERNEEIRLQMSSSLDFSMLNSKMTRDWASNTDLRRVTNISYPNQIIKCTIKQFVIIKVLFWIPIWRRLATATGEGSFHNLVLTYMQVEECNNSSKARNLLALRVDPVEVLSTIISLK